MFSENDIQEGSSRSVMSILTMLLLLMLLSAGFRFLCRTVYALRVGAT